MTFRFGRFEFACSWLLLAVYIVLLSILCALGTWQLGRSDEKRAFLARQQAALEREILDLNDVSGSPNDDMRYRRVMVKGRPDPDHTFLIDNQIVDGKVGYFVLTPFFIEGRNEAIMINRGWTAMGHDRTHVPDVGISQTWTMASGRLNQFPAVGIKLKGAEMPSDGWPSRVQVVETDILSAKLGYPVYRFQLELDPDQPNGYRREWKIDTPIPPEKHIAYAVQWFSLAFVLTVLFLWNSLKQHRG